MDRADDILDELGRDMGIDALRCDTRGHVSLGFASGRRFCFEKHGDALMLGVAEPAGHDLGERLLDAMRRADASQASAWPVQVIVVRDDDTGRMSLLAVARLDAASLTFREARRLLTFLDEWLPSR